MKYQSGRSMLEMIAVVGIIGILTVAGVSGLGGGTASMRATSAQYDIEEYAKRIIEVNAWNRDGCFNDIGNVDMGDLPENLRNLNFVDDCDATCDEDKGKHDGFYFEYTELSRRECSILRPKFEHHSELSVSGDCNGDSNTLRFTYQEDACPQN